MTDDSRTTGDPPVIHRTGSGNQHEPGPDDPVGGTEDERLLEGEEGLSSFGHDAWRVFRIMGEFVEGFQELSTLGPAVSIFGSARVPPEDAGYQLCVQTARLLGEAGFSIITGGGPGMMEAANKGAKEAGVTSVGCNIELPFEQHENPYLDLSIDFRYFFVRKTMFVKYAEAFVIFPGGFGTMDELFEALTLIQTGKVHDFPVVLMDTDYWGGLWNWVRERMLAQQKIGEKDIARVILTDSPEECVEVVVERFRHREMVRKGLLPEAATPRGPSQ